MEAPFFEDAGLQYPLGRIQQRCNAQDVPACIRVRSGSGLTAFFQVAVMNCLPGLTQLIHRAQRGDAEAADALYEATYAELRRLARARLRAGPRHTFLDTGALVHESYVRFAEARQLELEDRVHFMRWAGRVMRSVIVDFARRRRAGRRGGGAARVTLDVESANGFAGADEILSVHEALERVAALDTRLTQVVEMRYFGGMTELEIARALGVTERTVRRDWLKARLLLREALQ
jgi:RNA polymerase sigma factor (TIGR02999 family)